MRRTWPHAGDAWFGTVVADEYGRMILVFSPLWPDLPPPGTEVEVRVIGRSPYWALVDDD